ncbi:MAG: hypothetical protein HY367_01985 [Candidatus Aenigmarchaeota archaeon]|nr:hypothetical protein [Candidatus Aenigmarchaeota archaeon]
MDMKAKETALVLAFIAVAAFLGIFMVQGLLNPVQVRDIAGKYTLTVNVGKPHFDVEVRTVEDQARALAMTGDSGTVQFKLDAGVYVVKAWPVLAPGLARQTMVILDADRTVDMVIDS